MQNRILKYPAMEKGPLMEVVPCPFGGNIKMLQECTVQLDTNATEI